MYPIGTYKTVTLSTDGEFIMSKMFAGKEQAMDFAETLSGDWILMKLIRRGQHDDFMWSIEPEGSYEKVRAASQLGNVMADVESGKFPKSIFEIEKTQAGRLWSMIGFTGLMIYFATQKNLSGFGRALIIGTGLAVGGTVGFAYLKNEQRINQATNSV